MSPSFLHFFYIALFNKTVSQHYTVAQPIEETKRRIRTYLLETKRYTPSYFKNPQKDYYGRFSGLECRRITIQKIHRPKLFTTNIQQRLGSQLIAKGYLTPNENKTNISVKFKSYSNYIIWGFTSLYFILISFIQIVISINSTFNFHAWGIITIVIILIGLIQATIYALFLSRDYKKFNSLFLEL